MNNLCYIVILNYNGHSDTLGCIKSILNSNYSNYKIIIIDNKSTDDSINIIKRYIVKYQYGYEHYRHNNKLISKKILNNNITIIESKFNGGYAYGNNVGIQYSINKNNCKYIWILNNDTYVYPDTLDELINSDKKTNTDTIWGSKVLNNDKTIQSLGCRLNKIFMNTKHNYNRNVDSDGIFILNKLDYIHGCSIFFKKKIIYTVGLFDEDYFLYYEDVDFSQNAIKYNIKLNIAQKSRIVHKEAKTIHKSNYEYLSVTNRIKLSKKYFPKQIILTYLGIYYELAKCLIAFKFNKFYNIAINLYR